MALSNAELNLISELVSIMKTFESVDARIEIIDTQFNGTANWAADVTQANVDEVGSFAATGLQSSNILAAIYAAKTARAAWRADLVSFIAMLQIS